MKRIWGILAQAVATAFAAKEWLNLWQWSDRFVYLSSKWTARPGPYDSSFTYYLRGPMEALSDRKVRFVTIVKGAQVGFTTMLANFIMWLVDMDPGPTLLAMPSSKMARRFVRKELHPRFLECKRLEPYLPSNLRTHFTISEMYFRTMDFFAGGAGNAASLASLPIKNALADEIDKWAGEDDKEASRKDLLEARTITYIDTRKVVLGSSPTVPENTISHEAEKGTCEHYEAPCPHCGHFQEILFENFDWTHIKGAKRPDGSYDVDLVEKGTKLRCTSAECGKLIDQTKKHWMIRRGRWHVTNANAPADHRSFFVTGEIGNLRWGTLAKIYLQLKDTPGGLHHFHNSYLGRAWVRTAGSTTKKMLRLIQDESPKYDLQHPEDPESTLVLPIRPVVITMHVDVQQTDFWWTMRAWDADGSRYLLACGNCVSYQEIIAISNRVWKWDDGSGAPPEEHTMWMGVMDSGYRAKRGASVYNFVHEQGGRWIASKGGGYRGKDAPIIETQIQHIYKDQGEVTIDLLQYNDDVMKEHLYRFVIRERRAPKFYLPQKLEPEYVSQITAEKLVKKKGDDGRAVYKWEAEIDPHLGDCEKIGELFGFILTRDVLVALRAKQDATRESVVLATKMKALN
jgi:Bacteriophage tail assembly protein